MPLLRKITIEALVTKSKGIIATETPVGGLLKGLPEPSLDEPLELLFDSPDVENGPESEVSSEMDDIPSFKLLLLESDDSSLEELVCVLSREFEGVSLEEVESDDVSLLELEDSSPEELVGVLSREVEDVSLEEVESDDVSLLESEDSSLEELVGVLLEESEDVSLEEVRSEDEPPLEPEDKPPPEPDGEPLVEPELLPLFVQCAYTVVFSVKTVSVVIFAPPLTEVNQPSKT